MHNSKLQTLKSKIFLKSFAILIFISTNMYSQAGAKWATGGNGISTGDFLGTTNAYSLIFKTNNIQRGSFSSTGVFQINNLAGTGTGIAMLDANGNLVRTNFPNDPNKVLNGSGNFVTFSSASGWAFNGNKIYNSNSGFVGIGINSPNYLLDVNGSVHFNGVVNAMGLNIVNNLDADTIRGASAIKVNNNLNLTGGTQNNIYTTIGDLRLQSENQYVSGNTLMNITGGKVGVGIAIPQYKFDVVGDARVNGKIYLNRIVPLPGDSEIHFGDSSITYNTSINRISASPTTFNNTSIGGFTLGWGYLGYAYGIHSLAFGTNVKTSSSATNSVVIGSGALPSSNPFLVNTISNSLMIGFNSDQPTLFVGASSGIGTYGNVGIRTTSPQYELDVCGTIRAKEVRVNITGCDFVFDPTYCLFPLDSLDPYIKRNKHLYNVPPAAEMETADGVPLGKMNSLFLQKTEENTLYIIQLKKENDEMKAELAEMHKEIEELKKNK